MAVKFFIPNEILMILFGLLAINWTQNICQTSKINKIEKVQPLVGLLVFAVFFVLLVDIVNRKDYYKLNVVFPRSRRMRYSFVHRKIVHLKR